MKALDELVDAGKRTSRELKVESIHVSGPTDFGAHQHEQHQLAWMRVGEMELRIDDLRLHLHPSHIVWIPSNHRHHMTIPVDGHLITAYIAPHIRPVGQRWNRPVVVPAGALAATLLIELSDREISRRRRGLCQALLYDVLETAAPSEDILAVPRDPRARIVAEAILGDVANDVELSEWADRLAVSTKTLARAFVAETGMPFSRWRTTARLHRARRLLAERAAVVDVASAVGYRSSSAFITAYREQFGTTPGRDTKPITPNVAVSTSRW